MDLYTNTQMHDLDEVTQAKRAIAHMLNRLSEDPDIAYRCGLGTQAFSLLTEAAATLFKEPLESVRKRFAPTKKQMRNADSAFDALRQIVDRFDELNGTECSRGCGRCIRCIARRGLDPEFPPPP